MELIIGLDAHQSICQIAIFNKNGSLIKETYIETSQERLIQFMSEIKKPKIVIFEESSLSSWLKRSLFPYVNEIVVADPKENAWIFKSDNKNDKIDAKKLAKLYLANLIKEVYHCVEDDRIYFKEIALHYHDITKQIVRLKNKIKAKYRQKLIKCEGSSVYNQNKKEEWLTKLPYPITAFQVSNYMDVLKRLEMIKISIEKKIKKLSSKYPIIKKFLQVPGIGLISACTFFVIIDTPYRFSKRSKLWAYANLGKGEDQSAHYIKNKKVKNGNRLLKRILMGAVNSALKNTNYYSLKYFSLLKKNVSSSMAKRTIARNIATTMWSMWKSNTAYISKSPKFAIE